ncbi:ABC transporter substrate-binding protein [Butyrivibrio sp. JL13D10]|uniref:ABC transporter substrate-binding protein n=1 Tax=Butyrivibrio sp. JL13D10 TaxID=3236815 RepID=UPI0038B4F783
MKKRLALILVGAFLTLAACGKTEEVTTAEKAETSEAVDTADTAEPIHLVWWVYDEGVPKDLDKVLQKANEISAEKIGVTVEMQFKDEEKFPLDMTAGDYYDMTFTCDWCNDFDDNARLGYFYDITGMVREVAPELYKAVDPWWEIGTLNDRIYGVPMLKDLGAEVFFRLNSDYYEGEKGLTIPENMAFEDLEPMLQMWKEDNPDGYPLYMGRHGLSGMDSEHESIVSSYLVIPYSKAGTPEGTKVIPIWEDEDYMNMLRCLHRWYEKGYINPDAATTTELPYSILTPVRTGAAWTGFMGWSNPETVGFNVKLSRFLGPNMSRATEQGALFAINSAAAEENAKACLKYMELLYTDNMFRDILAYGIEGEHFNYYEGTVIRTDKGADGYLMDNFVTGPAISASVVSASKELLADPDQWTKVYRGYDSAKQSDTKGFSFNAESTEAEIAAMDAIWDSYYYDLVTGTIDPDAAMGDLKVLMENAGLLTVCDEAQRQLDEYLKAME